MRRALVALGVLLVASALAVGSGANFTADSVNAGNVIKAGIVALSGTSDGHALLTVSGLAPGHVESGTVDMTNSGDLDATLTLTAANLADTPASPALSSRLDLAIEDTTAGRTVYTGKLGAFSSADLGSWAPGAKHTLRFSVGMPDGGAGGADNAYQGARSSVDLTWRAVGVDPDPARTTSTTATTDTTSTGDTTTTTPSP